jgi:DNA repair protein RecO (recombination protein O)
MALVKDYAIILSTRPFGESDKIVRFFTLSAGKLTGIAKGAKKSQKRFMNTLEPFNQVQIEYFEKATSTMVRVENADLEESNGGLEVNLKRICVASFFTEFVDKLTKEKQKNEHLFDTLKMILKSLKTIEFTVTDILYYELQMLEHLGYMPNLASCVHCGKDLADVEKLYFSRERGGTLCPGCSGSVPHRQYPQGFIPRMLTLDGRWIAENSKRFERLGTEILEDFVSFHLAVELKSYRLLKRVTG